MRQEYIKKLGDVLTLALPIALLPLIYFLNESPNNLKYLAFFAGIYTLGNVIVQICKGIFDAPRPRESQEHVIYVHGYSHKDGESCISGHAMSAALPAYFALFFMHPSWICIPFILLAWICAWTRVKVKAHWPLDVIISNIIAFNINLLVAYCLYVI